MKKLVLTLSALAAFTGSAVAADLPAKAPMMAPVIAAVPTWTGCYLAGGFGYGMYNAESREINPITGVGLNNQGTAGGKGWMGQGQVGCDYQFAGKFVVGAFGDYTWSDVAGDKIGPPVTLGVGNFKEDWSWAVGGRIGYLVTPTFLSYFSGGYTETHFTGVNYVNALGQNFNVALSGVSLPGSTYNGWFLGSGFEYTLGFIAPSLYLKTEYRFSEFNRNRLLNFNTFTGVNNGLAETVKPFTQSVMTSLVWRFNWGAPLVAKY